MQKSNLGFLALRVNKAFESFLSILLINDACIDGHFVVGHQECVDMKDLDLVLIVDYFCAMRCYLHVFIARGTVPKNIRLVT